MSKVVLLAGGGGHTGYAYAIAQHLHNKCELESYVPTGDTLSYEMLKKFGSVKTFPKPRRTDTSFARFVLGLGSALIRSSTLPLKDVVVVSAGCNFCIAPCIKAWASGSPIINLETHERFVGPSKTARYLSRIDSLTALQWPEQKTFFPNGEVFGPIFPKREFEPHDDGYVLVTGGTYGHKALLEALDKSGLENVFVHAGPYYTPEYRKRHPNWSVVGFIDRFYEMIARAKLVVSHLGFTIMEAALVYGKPTVVTEYQEVTTGGPADINHLAKKVNSVLLTELSAESLVKAVEIAKHRKPPVLQNGTELLGKRIIEMAEA